MDGLLDETSDLEQLPAFAGGDESNEDADDHQKRRQICWDGCGRPSSVCLCPHLPLSPIPTSTRVVVLHHPHALRSNPRATVPVLSRCLRHVTTISGRRLRLGSSPLLDSLHHRQNIHHPAAALLFPGPGSVDLSRWAADTVRSGARPVLIAIDGTWGQAREMAAASLPFLSGFATRVALGGEDEAAEGPSTCESDLVLRKEPYKGCVSTMEAVARALRVIEPDGEAVEERLLSVLRAMVGFQARNLRPTKPRPRMKKKGVNDALDSVDGITERPQL